MSRGPDNIIEEVLAREIPEENRGSYVPEMIIAALEDEDYLIVRKDQVRLRDEYMRAASRPLLGGWVAGEGTQP